MVAVGQNFLVLNHRKAPNICGQSKSSKKPNRTQPQQVRKFMFDTDMDYPMNRVEIMYQPAQWKQIDQAETN